MITGWILNVESLPVVIVPLVVLENEHSHDENQAKEEDWACDHCHQLYWTPTALFTFRNP